jgi:ribokinase
LFDKLQTSYRYWATETSTADSFVRRVHLLTQTGMVDSMNGMDIAMKTTPSSTEIFVIGVASLDVLHLADGQTVRTTGGAGLYTALAARKSGASAGLFAPRPEPMPDLLRAAADGLRWVGPIVPPDQLPRLEIQHHGQGKATLIDAAWGAESQLTPASMPAEVSAAGIIHLAALSSAARQMEFREALQAGGFRGRISAGTYARLVFGSPAEVRQLFEWADLFFMNENEARGLFGGVELARTRPGAVLFVTLDAAGALVIEGAKVTHVPGHPVVEVDPTGAGDTFCGATLAWLQRGASPVEAAGEAVKLAAQTVSAAGPVALLIA